MWTRQCKVSLYIHGLVYSCMDKWPYTKLMSLSLPSKSSRGLLLKTHISLSNISALLAHPVCASHFFSLLLRSWAWREDFLNCFLTAHLLPFHLHSLNNLVPDSTIGGCREAANRQRWFSKVPINIPPAHSWFQSDTKMWAMSKV